MTLTTNHLRPQKVNRNVAREHIDLIQWSYLLLSNLCVLSSNLSVLLGVVSAEMFRNMQNSEIIRRMTEEFDEVPQPATAAILIKTDLIPVLENLIGQSFNFQNMIKFSAFHTMMFFFFCRTVVITLLL